MSIRKMVLLALAALAMLAAGTQTTFAGKSATTVKFTSVTDGDSPGTAKYEGKVGGKCRSGRKVTLIHNSDPPFVIGETTTDDKGNWTIEGPAPPDSDKITVKVKRNKKCKEAKETRVFGDLIND